MTQHTASDHPPIFQRERSSKFVMPTASQPAVVTGISVLAMVMGLFLLKSVWRTIRPGYVGIVFDKASHRIASQAVEPGWVFLNPISQDLQNYPLTIQTHSMFRQNVQGQLKEDNSVKVQSSEGQKLNVDVVIQYQIKRDRLNQVYQDWAGAPLDVVAEEIVGQYTRSQLPLILAQHGWEDITSGKRSEIAQIFAQQLRQEFQKHHLELISFSIPEVHLPPILQKALDAKLQAQQSAEQAQIRAVQAKLEAEGEAAALEVRSKAQADANAILSRSLTADVIRYQQLQKWDGKLPLFGGSGAMPMINASDLLGTPPQPKSSKP